MKITIQLTVLALMTTLFFACNTEDDIGELTSFESCDYLKARVGTSWKLESDDGSFSSTSTIIGDTIIDGRQVLISESFSGVSYTGCFENGLVGVAPQATTTGGTEIENAIIEFVLNEEVGYTWKGLTLEYQANGFDVTTDYTFTIMEKGMALTVSGVDYENVILIKGIYEGFIEGFDEPFSTGRIDYYFAPEVANVRSVFYNNNPFTGQLEVNSTIDLVEYKY